MLISSCPCEVGFVPGQDSIRFDKLVPMSIKNLLKWLAIFLLSNTTLFSPTRNSLEYFVSDFLLPIMFLRIFQVSLVLVYNLPVIVLSSFLDVRVLLTCFCTFVATFC